MNNTTIDLQDVLTSIDRLLAEVIRQNGPRFEVPFDYFWAILDPRLIDPQQEVPDVTIGQLTETLHMLAREVEPWEGLPMDVLGTPLRWLSDVLAGVAAQLERGEG